MATTTATDRAGNPIEIDSPVSLIGGTYGDCGRVSALHYQWETETWLVTWRPGHAQAIPRESNARDLLVMEQ